MALNKIERKIVFDKSGGLCWYCGHDLPERGWHADHFEPIGRYKTLKITPNGYERGTGIEHPHLDTIDNIVPSCSKCNLFKGSFSVEVFREEIERQVDRARLFSVNFRTAERFGLIEVTIKPIVFWFEEKEEMEALLINDAETIYLHKHLNTNNAVTKHFIQTSLKEG